MVKLEVVLHYYYFCLFIFRVSFLLLVFSITICLQFGWNGWQLASSPATARMHHVTVDGWRCACRDPFAWGGGRAQVCLFALFFLEANIVCWKSCTVYISKSGNCDRYLFGNLYFFGRCFVSVRKLSLDDLLLTADGRVQLTYQSEWNCVDTAVRWNFSEQLYSAPGY